MRIHRHAQMLNIFRGTVDLSIITASWLFAYFIRFRTDLIELTKGDDTLTRYASLLPALVVSYGLVFVSLGVYKRSIEKRRVWEETFDMSRAHLISFVVFSLLLDANFLIFDIKILFIADLSFTLLLGFCINHSTPPLIISFFTSAGSSLLNAPLRVDEISFILILS